MKKLSRNIFQLLTLILIICNTSFATIDNKDISNVILNYYLDSFNVLESDIHLRVIHYPNTTKLENNTYKLKLEPPSVIPKLGYQTLKLLVFEDGIMVKRYPVSIEVSIYKDIFVTIQDIRRNEKIDKNLLEKKRVLLSKYLDDVIYSLDEVNELVARKSIRKGKILRKSNLREKPDIFKGQLVKIRVINGDLTVLTEGTISQDARIGEEVKVNCNATGKRVKAIVESPEYVVIGL